MKNITNKAAPISANTYYVRIDWADRKRSKRRRYRIVDDKTIELIEETGD